MSGVELDQRLVALAALGDPLRRDLYHFVNSRAAGVTRDEAASQVGISRSLAAYHLDKLVAARLLETRFERRTGRRGPGAGRTAKVYERSANVHEVSLPARDYPLIAEVLARALEAAPSDRGMNELQKSARAVGAEVAAKGTDHGAHARRPHTLHALLTDRGYEPYDDDGVTRLRNCPFEQLAQTHRDLVCRANLAFIEGLLEGRRQSGVRAVLDPGPQRCCVALV